MKLTKKQEVELMQVYNTWWHSYLNGDVQTYDSFLEDDFRFVGSTGSEEFLNRKDTTAFFEATAQQLAGNAKLENVIRTIEPLEGMVLITDLADTFIKSGTEWVYYARFRFTSMLRNTKNGWRFFYQHFSTPDLKAQEGETIGLEKVSAENLELRSAIKRRTAELELKNRELEIEAALERVRARAMGMTKSDELSDLVNSLFAELTKLDFALSWCIINIIDEPSLTNMVWGANPEIGKPPESYHMKFEDHRFHHEMLAAYQKRLLKWVFELKGKEKEHYDDYLFNETEFRRVPKPVQNSMRNTKKYVASFTFSNFGGLQTIGEEPLSEANLNILSRFGKVFDLTYTRFNDLKKAEEQAREAQIEVALERVRSRTMAMHHGNELADTAMLLFEQISTLGIKPRGCGFLIMDEESQTMEDWSANIDELGKSTIITGTLAFDQHPFISKVVETWRARKDYFIGGIHGKDLQKYYKAVTAKESTTEQIKKKVLPKVSSEYTNSFFFEYGMMYVLTPQPINEQEIKIMMRFASVFKLTYRRFLDIRNAEAQAREAQIELSLERVRARTMAMQQSHELGDVATVLFKELNELVENLWTCGFVLCEKGRKEDEWWLSTREGFIPALYLPNIGDATHHNIYNGWINGESYHTEQLEGKSLQEHYDWLMTIPEAKIIFDDMEASGLERPTWQKLHCAYFSYGYLVMITQVPCPEEEIFKRFAKVFDQTYRRFLDLQKAEAQAREAEIELALERVRARTMAMQHSTELADTSALLFQQIQILGVSLWSCGFNIWEKEDTVFTSYMGSPDGSLLKGYKIPLTEEAAFIRFKESRNRGDKLFIDILEGDALETHYQYFQALPGIKEMFEEEDQAGRSLPSFQIHHLANFSHGNLMFITYEHCPEAHDIFIRFAKVFEQTYTRFLDLQKAEAQARESQIQLSLERLRARSMAMKSADELHEVLSVLFRQFDILGIKPVNVFLSLFDRENRTTTYRASGKSGKRIPGKQVVKLDNFDAWTVLFDKWENDSSDSVEVVYYPKEVVPEIFDLFSETFSAMPEEDRMTADDFPNGGYSILGYTPFGYLGYDHTRKATAEEKDILTRFCVEFGNVYQRFLDIQKAEAQAREAQIEAALERVRSRTMAMQRSEELLDVASVLFQQVKSLGVPQWNCGFNIWNIGDKEFTYYPGSPDGIISPSPCKISLTEHPIFRRFDESRKRGDKLLVYEKEGEIQEDHYKYMLSLPEVGTLLQSMLDAGFQLPTFQIDHLANFAYGNLIFITYEHFPEMHDVFMRFAKVFEQTYTRFLDLQKAEAQAREAQIEVSLERVRSRAMAMHHTDELTDVLCVLFDQFDVLGINPVLTHLTLMDEENETFSLRITTSAENRIVAEQLIDINAIDAWKDSFKNWKNSDPNAIDCIDYSPEQIPVVFELLQEVMDALPEGHKIYPKDFPEGLYTTQGHFKFGYLGFNHTRRATEEEKSIVERFAKEFGRTYQRFLDLQKAEAQAREAQIEAALEKVRSRSLAMHNTTEMQQVANEIQIQLLNLGLDIHALAMSGVIDNDADYDVWVGGANSEKPLRIPYNKDTKVQRDYNKAIKERPELFTKTYAGKIKDDYFKHLMANNSFNPELEKMMLECSAFTTTLTFMKNSGIQIVRYNHQPFSEADNSIVKRFGKVFEQAYIRFLDLQKAEAQARESQIEAALEKVRSRSLAMHKPEELQEVVAVVAEKLQELGVIFDAGGVILCTYFQDSKDVMHWIAVPDFSSSGSYLVPYFDNPIFNDAWDSKNKGDTYFSKEFSVEAKNSFFKHAFENSDYSDFPDDYKQHVLQAEKHTLTAAWSKNSAIIIPSLTGAVPTESDAEIMKRFAKVFEQAYIRFMDLQKSEAQAREAQIEAALERLRAQSMAMHKTEELSDVVKSLFEELKPFGFAKSGCELILVDEKNELLQFWNSNPVLNKIQESFNIPRSIHPFFQKQWKAWKNQVPRLTITMEGEEKKRFDQLIFTRTDFKHLPEDVKKFISHHGVDVFSLAIMKHGLLEVVDAVPISEDMFTVLERFAKVFEQSYTRFLDLQKAESQAREAQIEWALERVRSRSMAMQKSEELKEVIKVIFDQMAHLNINAEHAGIVVDYEPKKDWHFWVADTQDIPARITVPYLDLVWDRQFTEAKKKGENFFTTLLDFEEKNSFYKELLPHIKGLTKKARDFYLNCPGLAGSTVIQRDTGLYIENFSGIPYSEEENNTLMRFGKVFQQTYTRFLDLQKAESQARQAEISLGVERVRAKALAMHKSEDIMEVVAKLKEEVMNLNIPGVVAATIFLNEGDERVRMWDLSSIEKLEEGYEVPLDITFTLKKTDPHLYVKRVWENPEDYFVEIQDEKGFKRITAWLREHHKIKVAEEVEEFIEATQLKRLYHAAKKLNNGKLCIDLLDPPLDEMESILTKMGAAFDLAYKRFEDLQKAEAQAREAQIEAALERLRSRTMAMQNSTDLSETSVDMFKQMQTLGVRPWACGFNIFEKDERAVTQYMAGGDGLSTPFTMPLTEERFFIRVSEARQRGEELFVEESGGHELEETYKYMFSLPGSQKALGDLMASGFEIPKFQIAHCAFFSQGYLLFITYEPCPEAHDIFKRFAKVFQQTYTRFLDLQKAEAQARESQIEAALERVRSKTMAMHNSQDVGATVGSMFDELVKLGIEKSVRCGIGILDQNKPMELWTASSNRDGEVVLNIGFLDMSLHPLLNGVVNAWKKKETNFTYELKGKDLLKYFTALNESPEYLFHVDLKSLPKKTIHNSFLFSEGTLFAFSPHPLTEEEEQIFKRFAGVFGQTYTRYLDLLKAEAQAREAEIEAALERVRSQTMAMHNSQDVGKTVVTFFDEVMKLGLNKSIRCGIGILEDREKMETWSATSYPNGDVDLQVGLLDMKRHPLIKGLETAWKNKEDGYSYELIGEDVVRYYEQLVEEPDYPFHVDLENLSDMEYHKSFFFSSGIIFTFTKTPISEEAASVLKRFAGVFGQTYRRFLDLQKAEAQAKEAQIEAALEKVRSRTMAMQASSELQDAANVLFLEIQALGINAWSAGYNILSDDKTSSTCWMSSEGELQDPFPLYYTDEASFIEMGTFLKGQDDFFVQELQGKALEQHYDYMKSLPELKDTFKHIEDVGLTLPAYQINHLCKFSQGYLLFITYEKVPEAHDIFKRFTKVFEQTYTRFLDLQKAENQSKEAQIELALERVRASTMAMHKSEQLAGTAQVLFEQFDLLGIIPDRISIAIFNEKKRIFELWATDQNGTFVNHAHDFSIDEPTCMAKTYEAWKEGKETFVVDLKGNELKDWIRFVKEEAKMELDESKFQGRRVQHSAFFSQGYLLLSSHLPIKDEMMQLLLRFAKVFQQTFTRFLDLQKAETQAREAIKRASVDRVRAEIASMRTTTDLKRITPLIWNELTALNVPFIRCGVFIMDEEQQQVQTHLSTPDGKAIASFNLPFDNTEPLTNLLPYWRKKEVYKDHWDESAFIESTKILMQRGAIASSEKYATEKQPTDLYLHFLPFLQGMLYVGSEVSLSEDELNLAQNLAEAFSTAFSRYEDFNKLELANKKIEKTLVDLKQTQTQLIQSEKMASLGELTAGIAHEIQNPLNFVNNFSEVSYELMKEMLEELERGDLDEAKHISHDIEQNLEKINHHGKRASDIVKGMLEHSRKGDGKKDLTDINKLADEYLRLAYHGLRAKDKSFNADFSENFEKDLPLIPAIPQDIGRVLLNLISNAFYAVSAKDKEGLAGYKPTVVVSTKKINDLIEIRVKDNGSGVSESIRDKVFQPFFTTKPTGQGTGLGLSMSYDIITKGHNGSLDFVSTEGEGSEFIIQLKI